ncbi:MFS transporter [Marinomonas sp. TI.3.20]|uniref:MFS transporter n=1 Tax=Marinomonas sp. TI.3.20 TaxID=3121296 RepID=UPI00311F49D8
MNTSQKSNELNKKSNLPIIFFLSLSLITALINSSVPTPLYPYYKEIFKLSATMVSVVYGAYATGVIIALLVIGKLSNLFDDKRILILPSLFIVFIAGILFSRSNSFLDLFIARFLTGIATGGLTGAANISLLKICKKDNGKTAAFIAVLSFTLGLSLGPLISGLSIEYNFYYLKFPFYIISLFSAISFIGIAIYWPKKISEPITINNEKKYSNKILHVNKFIICAISLFLCWMFAACILTFGPTLSKLIGGDKGELYFSFIITAYLLIAGVSQIISKKLESKHSVIFGYTSQLFSFSLLFMGLYFKSPLLSLAGFILAGYAYGALFVGSASLVNHISNEENHARSISLLYLIAYTANWIPILIGFFVDIYAIENVTYISLLSFSLIEILVLFLFKKTQF